MKFHDLAIGQRFELDGAAYVKTSPVLASREDGGEKKFLPRYVAVLPLDGAMQRPAKRAENMLQADAVLVAFNAYHERCKESLMRLGLPADTLQVVTDVLEERRQDFVAAVLKG